MEARNYFIYENGQAQRVSEEAYNSWEKEHGRKYAKELFYPQQGIKVIYWFQGNLVQNFDLDDELNLFYTMETAMTFQDYQKLIDNDINIPGIDLRERQSYAQGKEDDILGGEDIVYCYPTWEDATAYKGNMEGESQAVSIPA